MSRDLTEKQRRFVEAYCGPALGNAAEAARLAGYKADKAQTFASIGEENLRKPEIASAVGEFRERTRSEAVSTVSERKEFLSRVHRGHEDGFDSKDRLRAVELLGKMEGDFAPVQHEVKHGGKVEMKPDFGALTEADQDQLRKLLGKAAEG